MARCPLGVPDLARCQRAAHVGAERRVSHAGLLNPNDVEVLTNVFAHQRDRFGRCARHVRNTDPNNGAHELRVKESELPSQVAAPVVADDDGLLNLKRAEQRRQIAGQRFDVVGLDRLRRAAAAETAQVGRDRAPPRLRDRLHLMAPRIPKLREAVEQQHGLALAALGYVQFDLAELNLLVRDCGHAVSL